MLLIGIFNGNENASILAMSPTAHTQAHAQTHPPTYIVHRAYIHILWCPLYIFAQTFYAFPLEASLCSQNITPAKSYDILEILEHFVSDSFIKVIVIVIVIVNSWFLERPQKRSRRNQLIYRRLTKTKSIGSGQDPKSQAGRQSDGYGGWCLELRRGGRHVDEDESG